MNRVDENAEGSEAKEAFPQDQGGDVGHRRLPPTMPRNPAVAAHENRLRNPAKFGLDRKQSFGVPKIKNHKELLKGMFQKKEGGMPSLKEREASAFHVGGAGTSAFPGANVPSMKSFEPLPWSDYFDDLRVLETERGSFGVYVAGWPAEGQEPRPVIFAVHGGGYTGLTWSLLAKRLKDKYAVVAMDLRSHGLSEQSDDFSIEAMAQDACSVWNHLCGETKPKTVVLGHSLGGAVAIHVSSLDKIPSLAGTVVIDVVEGTALASLPYMGQVIGRRPDRFSNVQDFVKYAYTSGLTKNFEAARVSGASQVVQDEEGGQGWRWRTDLRKTEKWWREWYEGLSAKFLSVPAPKLLLLAGTDRLDKELTIGHMAGKFQLKVLPAGHAIQEDEPEKTADAVDEFIQRYL